MARPLAPLGELRWPWWACQGGGLRRHHAHSLSTGLGRARCHVCLVLRIPDAALTIEGANSARRSANPTRAEGGRQAVSPSPPKPTPAHLCATHPRGRRRCSFMASTPSSAGATATSPVRSVLVVEPFSSGACRTPCTAALLRAGQRRAAATSTFALLGALAGAHFHSPTITAISSAGACCERYHLLPPWPLCCCVQAPGPCGCWATCRRSSGRPSRWPTKSGSARCVCKRGHGGRQVSVRGASMGVPGVCVGAPWERQACACGALGAPYLCGPGHASSIYSMRWPTAAGCISNKEKLSTGLMRS